MYVTYQDDEPNKCNLATFLFHNVITYSGHSNQFSLWLSGCCIIRIEPKMCDLCILVYVSVHACVRVGAGVGGGGGRRGVDHFHDKPQ